jgi:Concanavalin A-like lectin/glucanases superfamily/Phosphoesterase family
MKRAAGLVLTLCVLVGTAIFLNRQSASATPGYRDAVMADGPVAYWRLDEPAGSTDAASQTGQFPGVYVGSPTLGQPGLIAEDSDTAVHFDGVDDRVTANGLTGISSWPDGYSLEAWVTTDTTTQEGHIMAFNTSSGGNRIALFRDEPTDKFKFHDCEATGCAVATSTTVPLIGNVYHVVVTVDSSNNGVLYVNGSAEAVFVSTNRPPTNGLFSIGAEYDAGPTPNSFWSGTIDEAAVYQKALTASQVQAHYQAGLPAVVPTPTDSPTATPTDSPTPTPTPTDSPTPTPTPTDSPTPSPTDSPTPTPTLSPPGNRKVMWVMMENRNYSVLTSKSAPYLKGTLVPAGGSATNMHSESKPSLPNYVAITTGSTQGIADNKAPSKHHLTSASIFSQTDPSWKTYAEAMPKNCSQANSSFSNSTAYVFRHNPAVYMVSPPLNAPNSDCNANDVPMGDPSTGALASDLAAGTLPDMSMVVPGLCHDMDAAPSGSSCSPTAVTSGDQWLAQWMPKIFNSPDYTNGSLVVFLTWDEGSGGSLPVGGDCLSATYVNDASCHIPTLVFSKSTVPGTKDATYFTHYSIVKTTEELLGVSTTTLGSNVANAASMASAFNLSH